MAFSTSFARAVPCLPHSAASPAKKNVMQIRPLVISGLLGIKDAAIRESTVPSSRQVGR